MLLSPFSSLLGEAETVVTIWKHNTRHHNQHTHTVPTVIGSGPSLSLNKVHLQGSRWMQFNVIPRNSQNTSEAAHMKHI